MSPILANQLSGKQVMSKDGRRVGRLYSLTVDPQSGNLETVIVETDREEIFGIEQTADGRIHLPATVLETVSDHLIISAPSTRSV